MSIVGKVARILLIKKKLGHPKAWERRYVLGIIVEDNKENYHVLIENLEIEIINKAQICSVIEE
jgi:hypothetical protein